MSFTFICTDDDASNSRPIFETLEQRCLLSASPVALGDGSTAEEGPTDLIDIAPSIDVSKLPDSLVAGDPKASFKTPIEITNLGNTRLSAKDRINIEIYGQSAGGGTNVDNESVDVLLATLENVSLGNLKPGKTKKFKVKLQFPAGTDTGQYLLHVKADTTDVIAETDETNNEATTDTADAIDVQLGFVDLVGEFKKAKLPGVIVKNLQSKVNATVTVSNLGNLPLPKGQKIDVRFIARQVGGSDEVVLRTVSKSLSNLKPGKSKNVGSGNVKLTVPGSAAAGNYELVAEIDTGNALTESTEDNNDATVDTNGQTPTVSIDNLVPDSLADRTLFFNIKGGSGELDKSGSYTVFTDPVTDDYVRINNRGEVFNGTYAYTKSTDTTGDVVFFDPEVGPGQGLLSGVFDFTGPGKTKFSWQLTQADGTQFGDMTFVNRPASPAPNDFLGMKAKFYPNQATSPFNFDPFTIAFDKATTAYKVLGRGGSSGTYTFSRDSDTLVTSNFNDSQLGNIDATFTFLDTETALYDLTGGGGSQSGIVVFS